MIGLIATILMQRFALDPLKAGWIARGILLSLAVLALWGAYAWSYDRGRDAERARWEQKVAAIRKERDAAMAQAGEADAKAAGAIEATITDNRKALDDETANLPDRPLSDRQRARACRELVQQGRRCEPSASAPGKAGS